MKTATALDIGVIFKYIKRNNGEQISQNKARNPQKQSERANQPPKSKTQTTKPPPPTQNSYDFITIIFLILKIFFDFFLFLSGVLSATFLWLFYDTVVKWSELFGKLSPNISANKRKKSPRLFLK